MVADLSLTISVRDDEEIDIFTSQFVAIGLLIATLVSQFQSS